MIWFEARSALVLKRKRIMKLCFCVFRGRRTLPNPEHLVSRSSRGLNLMDAAINPVEPRLSTSLPHPEASPRHKVDKITDHEMDDYEAKMHAKRFNSRVSTCVLLRKKLVLPRQKS